MKIFLIFLNKSVEVNFIIKKFETLQNKNDNAWRIDNELDKY